MIRRLVASRYRSLGTNVSVEFGPLTVLVGQNGAGKSNTIDALVFLADCMLLGLEGAITKRGGIQAIRHAGSQGGRSTFEFTSRFQRMAAKHTTTLC